MPHVPVTRGAFFFRMGRRNYNARSLTPTTRAEENARSVDGVRDDNSFLERVSGSRNHSGRDGWGCYLSRLRAVYTKS